MAARHLHMMKKQKASINVMLFKEPNKDLYKNLIKTLSANEIPVCYFDQVFGKEAEANPLQQNIEAYLSGFDMIVDGIFGFSFKPPIREPYNHVLSSFSNINVPIFSIDIPSGWDVEKGNANQMYEPNYLISLTLPKLVAKFFKGKHYLGGRFIPECMLKQYKWDVPEYPGD